MNKLLVTGEANVTGPENEQTPYSNKVRRPIEKRWIMAIGILFFLAIIGFNVFYKYAENQQGPIPYLTDSGDVRQLSAAKQKQFADMVRQKSDGIKIGATNRIAEQVEMRIDTSFDQLQKGVGGYLEWYFSAPGSYTRMYAAITGDLDEWAAKKIRERLLNESGYTDSIESLTSDYPEIQNRLVLNELDKFRAAVDDYLNTYGTEVDLNSLAPDAPVLDFANITQGPEVAIELDRIATSAKIGRIAAVGGLATAAVQYGGIKAATLFVRQFLSRVALHSVRGVATGASSAGAASFTGPIAIGIGIAATTTYVMAFVGTEYIALNAQETLYKPKMEQDLREFIELKRAETKAAYQAVSTAAVDRALELLLEDIAEREKQAKIHKCYRVLGDSSC